MASEGQDLFSEQELTCSICLDLFTDPVTTPCGHNFCQGCIGGYWASSPNSTCPLCKRQFQERPRLSINRTFALIADKYKEVHYGAADPQEGGSFGLAMAPPTEGLPAPPAERVWCDVCTGVKQPAVSSCLTCTASYCREHVAPHRSTPFYAKHPLMDPQEALRGRTCALHRRLLEVFCRTCQSCICAICVLEEHRTHATVSVQTERLSKQKHISRTEQEIVNRIKAKDISLSELRRKLEAVKNYAAGERSQVEALLDAVAQAVAQVRSQVLGGIQEQLDGVMATGEGRVKRLEEDLSVLTDKRLTLEAQAISQDHISFLQSFADAASPLEVPEHQDDADLTLHFHLAEVRNTLGEVKDRMVEVSDRISEVGINSGGSRGSFSSGDAPLAEGYHGLRGASGLRKSQWSIRDLKKIKPVSGHKKARVYEDDVTLNPVTAYPFLILSEDRKQVKRGEKLQFYRNSPQRFDVWSCVLAKDAFSAGRHYWEVFVGENKDWKVGVVTETAQRKGLFDMSPPNGYYALWWSNSQLRALTTPPLTKVKAPPKLRQVGVFLDLEAGQVTFYNSKSGSELYSFSGAEFHERMFPMFGTGDKDVPLVLMTSQLT